jgi:hypothetical protein
MSSAKLRSVVFSALIVLIVLSTRTTSAVAEGGIRFGADGRFWKVVFDERKTPDARDYKLLFLRGVFEGLIVGASPMVRPGREEIYLKGSPEDFVTALDQFYSDYRNEKVFVVHALKIISMEMRGEPQDKIDALLRQYRRFSSQ